MIRNGNSGTNSKHQLLHPSRRVDQGDDSPVNSPVHQRPRLTGISVASAGMVVSRLPSHRELSSMSLLSRAESCTSHSTGAEFDSWAVQHQPQQRQYQRGSSRASVMSSVSAASASMMVSRLPSHRELSQSLNRTESFASHSTGAEFDSWAVQRNSNSNSSRALFSSAASTRSMTSCTSTTNGGSCSHASSSIPAAPHLLRVMTQSSARNMFVSNTNTDTDTNMHMTTSSVNTGSGGSGGSAGGCGVSVNSSMTMTPTRRRPQHRRGRFGRGHSSNSSNSPGSPATSTSTSTSGRRPTNPMALLLRTQNSGSTTTRMDVDVDVGFDTHAINCNDDSLSYQRLLAACEMTRLTHRKSSSGSVSSLPSLSTSSGQQQQQHQQHQHQQHQHQHQQQQHQHQNYNHGNGNTNTAAAAAGNHNHNYDNSPWQPGSHHFSAFHRRASM
jgi:hypothetical protein